MSNANLFRLAVLAAVIMLGVGLMMGVSAPPCRELPMSTLTAFELARSVDDLQRIFGTPGALCRAPLVVQLDHANVLDAAAYIPAYTAFYALALFAMRRADRLLGWIAVAIIVLAAVADWVEDWALFQLSAAPDQHSDAITVLIAFTNIKWVGLAVATTLGGVMLLRRGGLGWIGLVLCAAPLVSSVGAVIAPDMFGQYLIPGMAVASIMLLGVALWGSVMKEKAA